MRLLAALHKAGAGALWQAISLLRHRVTISTCPLHSLLLASALLSASLFLAAGCSSYQSTTASNSAGSTGSSGSGSSGSSGSGTSSGSGSGSSGSGSSGSGSSGSGSSGSGSSGSGSGSGSGSPTNPTLPSEQAAAAAAFTDSVGVVTHLSYTDTPYYTAFPQILSALEQLGVHHIRDGYYPWPTSSPIVQAHQQLNAAGIKCDYVVPYNLATTAADIATLSGQTGDMESLEAPNECDISGECGGLGATGVLDAVAFLPVLHTAASNLHIPLLAPSLTQQSSFPLAGNLDSEINFNNLHIYFGGRNPGSTGWGAADPEGNSYGSFSWWLDQANIDAPGMPSEITETGYIAYPTTTTQYTLRESVEASYLPRTLLVAFNRGFKRTMMYELLDEVSSPGYGLLRSDLSQKPAFTAVKNLLGTLADQGTFTPGSLNYAITGADSALNHLLLEKHDGSYWLVLWIEQSSWDAVNLAPVTVTAQNVGLELDSTHQTVTHYQFDSNGNVTALNQSMNGNLASLTVTDQISIVQIVSR